MYREQKNSGRKKGILQIVMQYIVVNYIVLYDSMIYILIFIFLRGFTYFIRFGRPFLSIFFSYFKTNHHRNDRFPLSFSLFYVFFIIQVWKCRVVPSRGSQNLVHLPPDMQLNSELIHNDNFLQLTMSSGREI